MRRADGFLRRTAVICFFVSTSVVLFLTSPARGAVSERGEVRQPRNIYELLYSFNHTFARILKGEELVLYRAQSPEQLKSTHPELYERISRDVKGWTDEWIEYVWTSVEPIPPKRLEAVQHLAERADGILRRHFEAQRWPYRPMRAVFLPPQVFLDERHRGDLTSGMFIPFYPDAFFASVDWPMPMELVIVHESLHFNKTGATFGRPLTEGITETAARYLVLKYELLTPGAVRRVNTYPLERRGIEVILDAIIERTSGTRDDAINLFLETYLTGRQDGMTKLLGAEPWGQVVALAESEVGWQAPKISKALDQQGPGR